jgi:hypothetical protein
MRKIILMLGTILMATILISGSAVAAALYYIMHVDDSGDCTDIDEILGGEDNTYATIGVTTGGASGILGCAVLNLSDANPMPPSTNFIVYGGGGGADEEYSINVSQYPNDIVGVYLGNGVDDSDEVFTTPSLQGSAWQFIIIRGLSGDKSGGDLIWGPEIDAVGWG